MNLIKHKNIILKSSREFLTDAIFPNSDKKLPLIFLFTATKVTKIGALGS